MRTIVHLLFSLTLATAANADVIFSNFGPSDTFDMDTGLTVADSSGNNLKTSLLFIPTGDFQLTQMDFVTSLQNAGDSNQVTITISQADANGNPGQVIEAFSFSGQMGVLGSVNLPPVVLNAVSALNPVLLNGVSYWITAESSPDVTVVWNQNNLSPNDVGFLAQLQGAGWMTESATRGVFRLIGRYVTITQPSPSLTAEPISTNRRSTK